MCNGCWNACIKEPKLPTMQQLYILLLLLCPIISLRAQAPVQPSTDLTFTSITGGSTKIGFAQGDGENRIIVMSLAPITNLPVDGIDYNPDRLFGDGDELSVGAMEYVVFDGVQPSFTTFTGLTPGTTYYVAVFEYNGEDQQTEYLTTALTGTFETLSQPTVQVSNITATEVTGNSVLLSWDNGNGDGRLVVFREGGPVTANPVDLTSYGNLANSWRSGDEITPGNRVMFNSAGTRNAFTATQLEPGKEYFYDVFEYNGQGAGSVYAVPGASGSFTTQLRPSESGGMMTQRNTPTEGDRIQIRYSQGNGEGRLWVLKEGTDASGTVPADGVTYTGDTDFGDGDRVGTDGFAVVRFNSRNINPPTLQTFNIRSLEPNTTYTIVQYEFDYEVGFSGLINYQSIPPATFTFITAAAPTVKPADAMVNNNNGNTVDLSWTGGNGDNSFLVMKENAPVDFTPVDSENYGTSVIFGSQNLGNDNFGIYRGPNNPQTIRDLTPGATYYCSVWEYNGSVGPVYLQDPLTFTFVAPLTPSQSATDLIFPDIEGDRLEVGWEVGNGQRRLLIARRGSPVDAEPVDGVTYDDGGNAFGGGSALAPGQFVVADTDANGSNTRPVITNLEIGTVYHFALYEFNEDAAGNEFYRRTDPATGAQSTATVPTVVSPDFGPGAENAVSIEFDIAAGDGERRLLVLKEGSPVDFVPDNLTQYNTNVRFGQNEVGTQNYAIAVKSRFSQIIRVENLLANTTYHAALFEYNGANFPAYNPAPARYTFTTPTYATEDPTDVELRNLGAEQLQINYFRGNGSGRIVVAREAGTTLVDPTDGVDYLADDEFTQGSDVSGGNYVVADETLFRPRDRFIFGVAGLDAATDYVFTAYEVTTDGTDKFYKLPGTPLGVTTSAEPTVKPINLQVLDLLNESATLGWTSGDGLGEVVLLSERVPVSDFVATGQRVFASSSFTNSTASYAGNAQPVYFGQQTEVNVTRLKSGTEYFARVQAYNGWFQSPAYQQESADISFRTPGPPAIQAENIFVTNETPTRITLRWSKGGGTDRLLVAKEGSPVDAIPVDNEVYVPNTFFGSGSDLGNGNFVIAADDFDTISVTDLTAGAKYHFAVFEYNQDATTLYNTDDPPRTIGCAAFGLPVEWTYFRGHSVKEDAHLEWGTATETDADHFVLERSVNRGAFADVGRVFARGGGDYAFTDRSLPAGEYLYRLRQVDVDGATQYSRAITVSVRGGQRLSVYPNPVQNQLSISGAAAGAKYELRSQDGRVLRTGIWTGSPVSVGNLKSGIYVLRVGGGHVRLVRN